MNEIKLKNYILRIGLICIIIISVFSCIYSIKNYKNNNETQKDIFMKYKEMPPLGNNNKSHNEEFNRPEIQDGENQNIHQGNNDGKHESNDFKHDNNNQNIKTNGNFPKGGIQTEYLPGIVIYSIIFLIISILIYVLIKYKKIEFSNENRKWILVTLLACGFLFRISLSNIIGSHNDINLFKNWAETAANGFSDFYLNANRADYPPLYIYILAIIGKIISLNLFNNYYILILKMPSIIIDILTGYFIYKLSKKYLNYSIGIILCGFYIFNPAIFIDSTFWGQVDSVFTMLIIIALYFLSEKKYPLSSVLLSAAILMKPQGIIFFPILFFELLRERKVKNFVYSAVAVIIVSFIIIIPFSINQESPFWVVNLYLKTISEYPYASVNAFNFFSLIGANYIKDTNTLYLFSYHTFGMIFIVIVTLIGWYLYIKGNKKFSFAIATLQIIGVFTFSVGMHERYLFSSIALSLLSIIYLKDRRYLLVSILLSITNFINIAVVFFKVSNWVFTTTMNITATLNIIIFLYLIRVIRDNGIKQRVLLLK